MRPYVLHYGVCLSLILSLKFQGKRKTDEMQSDKAERLKPDLIILDLTMPIMDGLEAATTLRKMLPEVRLILFTIHDGSQVQRLAKAARNTRGGGQK
jgi:CheY-like chemotaxis protein